MRRAYVPIVSPIGVSCDAHETRLAQYTIEGGRPVLSAAAIVPARWSSESEIPDPQEIRRLRDLCERRGFLGNSLAIEIPSSACAFHILELPPESSGAPIAALASAEVQRSGAHGDTTVQVGTWTDPGSRFDTEHFAISAQTTRVEDAADSFERAGFQVERVMPSDMGLFRLAADHLIDQERSISGVLWIGWNCSHIVVSIGTTPIYTRRVTIGAREVLGEDAQDREFVSWAVRDDIEYDDSDVLARLVTVMGTLASQLDSALAYVSQIHRSAPFGEVWCAGYFAARQTTLGMVTDRVEMHARTLEPETESIDGFYEQRHASRLGTACGLAIGGLR